MADYDDAERNAIQELEPHDQVRWLLEEVDDDLVLFDWLQTQVAPPPGVPQLRCDCVAGLRSHSGKQPPWACLIEAQAQPLADMAVWMFIYLGLLRNVLRYEGRDRYQMMGVILNLSESALSHTIDWQVPLKKNPPTAPEAAAGQPATPEAAGQPAAPDAAAVGQPAGPVAAATTGPPAPPAPGVSCVFFIKNVRQESAPKTMDRIERGELGLCILVWVPLMLGADDPDVVRRWRDLAMRQTELYLRTNYAVLALVFAEMAGRKDLWKAELGGFSMQESTFIRGWRQEGKVENARAAVVNVLQARFPQTPVSEGVHSALVKNADLQKLTAWLQNAALTASPADFERFLATATK